MSGIKSLSLFFSLFILASCGDKSEVAEVASVDVTVGSTEEVAQQTILSAEDFISAYLDIKDNDSLGIDYPDIKGLTITRRFPSTSLFSPDEGYVRLMVKLAYSCGQTRTLEWDTEAEILDSRKVTRGSFDGSQFLLDFQCSDELCDQTYLAILQNRGNELSEVVEFASLQTNPQSPSSDSSNFVMEPVQFESEHFSSFMRYDKYFEICAEGPTAPENVRVTEQTDQYGQGVVYALSYTDAVDAHGDPVQSHQIFVERVGDSRVMIDWTNSSALYQWQQLDPGDYSVSVRAVDHLGNVGPASEPFSWTKAERVINPCPDLYWYWGGSFCSFQNLAL